MSNDLTNSQRDRQNVLNNRYALEKVEEHLDLGGILFEDTIVFTKHQLMQLFAVSDSTIERYLSAHNDELKANGYQVLKGAKLKSFKDLADGTFTDEGTIRTSILGVFTFRATLNLAMLLTESEQARLIRSRVLDIVIDVMAERSGGHTKFINQRDSNYLPAVFRESSYRQVFTDAIDQYLETRSPFKYANLTNKIYKVVFRENAKEYREILKLARKENVRKTFYTEVLTAISSIENGIAAEIKRLSEGKGRKLSLSEVNELIENAESNPFLTPVIEDARIKMSSRDLCFRDALHQNLEAYIQTVPESDFERFLGEASRSLEDQLSDPEILDVFKRLKDR